jgi:hypothetical protein
MLITWVNTYSMIDTITNVHGELYNPNSYREVKMHFDANELSYQDI